MAISSVTSVGAVGATEGKPATGASTPKAPTDRVSSLDITRATKIAQGVQAKVSEMRLVRLAHIGAAIRSGDYHPTASEVANRILDAAEIDGHLRAILTSR
jgi:anti-sigma28 factor (negative regulator of flagellin synthesis)